MRSPEPVAAARPIRIPVSRRALRTFQALFHVAVADKGPGEVPWNDFLYAMVQTGFGVEKMMGSSWMCTPPGGTKDGEDIDAHRDAKARRRPDKNKENLKQPVHDGETGVRMVTTTLKPITFHEPHPSSKLRMWQAKKIGRRLTITYGWTGETFVEK